MLMAGARLVECDIHSTLDGQIVLAHDACFRIQAADEESPLANTAIAIQNWADISTIELKDHSNPVLLSTVLDDLRGTDCAMAVEIKDIGSAYNLADLLWRNQDLIPSVGLVMGFDFEHVEIFHKCFSVLSGSSSFPFPVAWLICNPKTGRDKDEPAYVQTWVPTSESFESFLNGACISDKFKTLRLGIYMQQNPATTTDDMDSLRESLARILECEPRSPQVFIGLWNEGADSAVVDHYQRVAEFASHVTVINTDLPKFFTE
jgi:hypothetical protein